MKQFRVSGLKSELKRRVLVYCFLVVVVVVVEKILEVPTPAAFLTASKSDSTRDQQESNPTPGVLLYPTKTNKTN